MKRCAQCLHELYAPEGAPVFRAHVRNWAGKLFEAFEISETVQCIKGRAFAGLDGLRIVTIPRCIRIIGLRVFVLTRVCTQTMWMSGIPVLFRPSVR